MVAKCTESDAQEAKTGLELRVYCQGDNSIGMYLPQSGLETVTEALEILRGASPRHYALVEQNTQMIKATDGSTRSAYDKPTAYLSEDTLNKGPVSCLLALVHEAKHRESFGKGIVPQDEERLCIREEGNCLANLEPEHWEEAGIGWLYPSTIAYIGLLELQLSLDE